MATISTSIELQDRFTNVLNNIISSANLSISVMEDLNRTMNAPVDTASIEAARGSINQATIAVQEWNAAMQNAQTSVPASVSWKSDNMEVFSGTGMERFEQEVRSVDNLLNNLNHTQERIAATAAQINLLPADSVSDMDNMKNRLQVIQQRIRQIEGNPLNLGTATANSELEQLRGQLSRAVQEQENLNRAVSDMDIQGANGAYLQLSQTVGNMERYLRDNVDEQGRFNLEIEKGVGSANRLGNIVKGMIGAYATIQTARKLVDLSDTQTSTTARLNLLVEDGGSVEELEQKIMDSAWRSRSAYYDTASAVAKLGLNAGNAFDHDMDQVIAFMEQVNKQFVIGGASAQEQSNAMIQLTQAMAAGALRGEELNSILDGAPGIARAIESYMGIAEGSIKSVAQEGKVTAEVVKNAMFAAADGADGIDQKFNSMPMTWSQVFTMASNIAIQAIRPLLDGINWLANNISIIGPTVLGLAGAFAVFQIAAHWTQIATAATVLYNGVVNFLSIGFGILTGNTAAASAAALTFNSILLANPITWVVMLIMVLIGALYGIVAAVNKFKETSVSATGIIAGAFAVLGASVINVFIVPTQNHLASLANFIGNVFNDPVAAVKVLFYDMALTVIGYISNMAHAIENVINKIPGVTVDITSGLDHFYSGIEKAQKKVKDESGWVEYIKKMDYIDYSNAASAGYRFGQGIADKVSDSFKGDIGSIDFSNMGSGFEDISNDIGNIANNTADIKDSVTVTDDELKYLREIAEREAINRFTTAEVKLDFSATATLNHEMDVDGFIAQFEERLEEAMLSAAEGVHI